MDPDCLSAALASCNQSCHGAQFKDILGGGLDLSGKNLGARLSTTTAMYKGVTKNAANCKMGALIIDPTTPAESILLKKVTGTQACGDSMPPPSSTLMGNDLNCVKTWIEMF